jgi:arginine exporter protein ArgO
MRTCVHRAARAIGRALNSAAIVCCAGAAFILSGAWLRVGNLQHKKSERKKNKKTKKNKKKAPACMKIAFPKSKMKRKKISKTSTLTANEY